MDLPIDTNRGRLSYWLFYAHHSVAYAYAEVMRAHCEERGKPYIVTPSQWGALSLLLEHDGTTIGTLSQMRGVDAPAATGIISRLEQSGLVERRHDREDRRVVKVYLTDEGRDIANTLISSVEQFDQSLKQGFSESELDQLEAQLHRIITNASEIGPGLPDRFGLLSKVVMHKHKGSID